MAFVSDSIHKLSDWVMHSQRKKYIYGLSEGSLQDEAFLSRKAATLCELHRMGYSIPPAFILSSHVSLEYSQSESKTLEEPVLLTVLESAVVGFLDRVLGRPHFFFLFVEALW